MMGTSLYAGTPARVPRAGVGLWMWEQAENGLGDGAISLWQQLLGQRRIVQIYSPMHNENISVL